MQEKALVSEKRPGLRRLQSKAPGKELTKGGVLTWQVVLNRAIGQSLILLVKSQNIGEGRQIVI